MLTLLSARTTLWKYASVIDPTVATDSEKQDVDVKINQVIERFLNTGKWRGTIDTALFTVYDGQITLPRQLETALGAYRYSTLENGGGCGCAQSIYSQWYRFAKGGPGGGCAYGGLIDLGEGFIGFRNLPSAGRLRIKTTTTGESGQVLIRGYSDGSKVYTGGGNEPVIVAGTISPDATGQYDVAGTHNNANYYTNGPYILFSDGTGWCLQFNDDSFTVAIDAWFFLSAGLDPTGNYPPSGVNTGTATAVLQVQEIQIEGENMHLPATVSSTTSLTTFDAGNSVYLVVKPPTNGVIELYHVASDLTETLIASYEPGELIPAYRRYEIPAWRYDSTVTDQYMVRAKRAYVEAIADNDPIMPSNIGALKLGLQALSYEDNNDDDKAEAKWGKAFQLLDNDRGEFDGDSQILPFTVIGGYGAGNIPNII